MNTIVYSLENNELKRPKQKDDKLAVNTTFSRMGKPSFLKKGMFYSLLFLSNLFHVTTFAQTNCLDVNVNTTATCDASQQCWVEAYEGEGSHAFFLPALNFAGLNDGDDYVFEQNEKGIFTEYANGTAHLTGTIMNVNEPTKKMMLDIWLEDRKSWNEWYPGPPAEPTDYYKGLPENVENHYLDWSYYTFDVGVDGQKSRLIGTGDLSGEMYLEQNFGDHVWGVQVGQAATDKNANYGMSAWFYFSGTMIDNTTGTVYDADNITGDINADMDCSQGACNGIIDVSVSNGTPPYAYAWSDGTETMQDRLGLCCGEYTVTITDSDNCEIIQTFAVENCENEPTITEISPNCLTTCVTHFAGSNYHAFWLDALEGTEIALDKQYTFENGEASFERFPDGTAHLTGTIISRTDDNRKFEASVWFKDKRNWTEWQAFMEGATWKGPADIVQSNYLIWSYYLIDDGDDGMKSTLTGVDGTFFEGTTLYMRHNFDTPDGIFAFQVGKGANDNNGNYGASGWMLFNGVDADGNTLFENDQLADINVDFCEGNCTGGAEITLATNANAYDISIEPYIYFSQSGNTLNINYACEGDYELTLIDASGCANTTTISIPVLECCDVSPPTVSIDGDSFEICENDAIPSLQASSDNTPNATINWYDETNTLVHTGNSFTPNSLQIGENNYTVEAVGSCTSYPTNFTILLGSNPTAVELQDAFSCIEDLPYILDAGAGFDSYLWSNNETTQIIEVTEAGFYSVTVTENHCTAEASMTLDANICAVQCAAITGVLASVSAVCSGGVVSLTAEIVNGDSGVLTWYDANDEVIENPDALVLETDNCEGETMAFYATYVSGNGECTTAQSDSLEISVFPSLSATAEAQSGACSVELTPDCDTFTATWEDAQGNTGTGFSYTAETGTSGDVVFTLSNTNFPTGFTCLDEEGNEDNTLSFSYNCSECPSISSVSASTNAVCSEGVISLTAEVSNGDEGVLTWYNGNDEVIENPNEVVLTTENCDGETMSFYATYVPTNDLCQTIQSDNVEISVFPTLSADAVSQENECYVELTPACDTFTATWEDAQGNTGNGFSFTAETGTSGTVVFTLSNSNFPSDFTCLDENGNEDNTLSFSYNCSECPSISNVSASTNAVCSEGVISLTAEVSNGDEGVLTWYNGNNEVIENPNEVVLTTENCNGETMSFYATYVPANDLCQTIQSDNVEISVFPTLSADAVSQENECYVELTPDCDTFTATWEDAQGNTGNGFSFTAETGTSGTVVFTLSNSNFPSDFTCLDENGNEDNTLSFSYNCSECPSISNVSASTNAVCSDGIISLIAEVSNGDEGVLTWYNGNDEVIENPNEVVLTTENCDGETMSFYATYVPTNDLCQTIQSDNVEISVFPPLSADAVSQENECYVELTPTCDTFTATWEDAQGNTGNGFSFTAETGTSGTVVFTLSNSNFPSDFTCLDENGNEDNTLSFSYNCSECPSISNVSASTNAICSDGVISLTAEVSNGDEGVLTWYNSNDEEISNPNEVVLTTENCDGETMSFYATYVPANDLCQTIQSDNVEISVFPPLSADAVSQENECYVELTPACDTFTATWEDAQNNTGTGFSFTAMTGFDGNVVFTLSHPNFPTDFTCLDEEGNELNEISIPYNCSECPSISSVSASSNAVCSEGTISLNADISNDDTGVLTWYNSNDEVIENPNEITLTTENCEGETMSYYAIYVPANDLCETLQSDNVEISVFPPLSASVVPQSDECSVELTPACDNFTATWEDTEGNSGEGFAFTGTLGTNGTVTFTLSNPNFPSDFTCLDENGNEDNTVTLPYDCPCPTIENPSVSTNPLCSGDTFSLNATVTNSDDIEGDLIWFFADGTAIQDPDNVVLNTVDCDGQDIIFYATFEPFNTVCGMVTSEEVTVFAYPALEANVETEEDGCQVRVFPSCQNFTTTWEDSNGNTGEGTTYNGTEDAEGTVTFTLVNDAAPTDFSCYTTELTGSYNCGSCPSFGEIETTLNALCSGQAISLSTEILNDDGGEIFWYNTNDAPIFDPHNVVLTTNECDGLEIGFYAVYIPESEFCESSIVSEPAYVNVYPSLTGSIQELEQGCKVVLAPTCENFTATWEDTDGNTGSGLEYDAPPAGNGTVTFTLMNTQAPDDIVCEGIGGTNQLSGDYFCEQCPDIINITILPEIICSGEEVSLTADIANDDGGTLVWYDINDEVVEDPANVVVTSDECELAEIGFYAVYTTTNEECQNVTSPINNVQVYPTLAVSAIEYPLEDDEVNNNNECQINVVPACPQFTATWTDSFENSGEGFFYEADPTAVGFVTFTLSNPSVPTEFLCDVDNNDGEYKIYFACQPCPEFTEIEATSNHICSGNSTSLSATMSNEDAGILTWYNSNDEIVTDPQNVSLETENCDGEVFSFYAIFSPESDLCADVQSETLDITVYPTETATTELNDINGCTVTLIPACDNFVATWEDSDGETGSGFVYTALPATSGTVTFTLENPNTPDTLSCGINGTPTSITQEYDCIPCTTISDPEPSEIEACSGDFIALQVVVTNDDGGTLTWYDNDTNEPIEDPTNVLVSNEDCESIIHKYYAIYRPDRQDYCNNLQTPTLKVTVYPDFTATAEVSEDACTVTLNSNCNNIDATWQDTDGNTGSGNVYEALGGTSGNVTFTLTHDEAPTDLICDNNEVTAAYECNSCPTVTPNISANAVCSGGTISLIADIAQADGGAIFWADTDGTFIPNPNEVTLINMECEVQTVGFYAIYVTANDACENVQSDVVSVQVYPQVSGEAGLGADFCSVVVTPSCPNFTATWTDETGMTGTGFEYEAMPPAESGTATFTIVNPDAPADLNCGGIDDSHIVSGSYECGVMCIAIVTNNVSEAPVCSGETIALEAQVFNNIGGTFVWYDSNDEIVPNPDNVLLENNTCEPILHKFYGIYTPETDCDVFQSDTVSILTYPAISASVVDSNNNCNVSISTETCDNFVATWIDSDGNIGTGFEYQGAENTSGTVTFTISNTDAPQNLDCNTGNDNVTITQNYSCLPDVGMITGFVWNDIDANGIQNPSETGIANVWVYLINANTGVVLDSTQTNTNGIYTFEDIAEGSYLIEVGTPSEGFVGTIQNAGTDGSLDSDINPATNTSNVVSVVANETTEVDAGFYDNMPTTGTLTGFVWNDTDANGIQNPSEQGIPNVWVYLIDANTGVVLDSTQTNANGIYTFEDIAEGTYLIEVGTPSEGFVGTIQNAGTDGSLDSDINPATNTSNVVSVVANETTEVDAGFYDNTPQTGTLTGFVWNDTDANGIQNPSELGIADVLVYLIDANTGVVLDSTQTNTNGIYTFEDIAEGTYLIEVGTPSENFVGTIQNAGTDPSLDSDINPATNTSNVVSVVANETTEVDAGFYDNTPTTGTLTGFVWNDTDANGIQSPSELGIANVWVYLIDANTGVVLDSTQTNANGIYTFEDIAEGTYLIEVGTPSEGFVGTIQNAGTDGSLDSDINPSTNTSNVVSVVANETTEVDAGFYDNTPTTGTLTGFVWNDTDANGIQNPSELGIADVLVYLIDANTGVVLDSTQTNANGIYTFEDIAEGTYLIEVGTPSEGFVGTIQNAGTDPSLDSDINPATNTSNVVSVVANETTEVDAGFYDNTPQTGTLTGFVWNDTDANGIQSPSELGIADVLVYLIDANTGVVLDSTQTNTNGIYTFEDIAEGSYLIEVGTPSEGFVGTIQNAGTDGSLDSDINPATNTSNVVSVVANETTEVDAGFYDETSFYVTIGDYVWSDINQDGIQDADESGISGITVLLWNADSTQIVATAVTDMNGSYLFENIPAGNYIVTLQSSVGISYSTPNSFNVTVNAGESYLDADFGLYVETFTNPAAINDTIYVCSPNTAVISPLENDIADGSPLANVSSFSAFANNVGTATLNADQTTINYNVDANASGTDIFTYTVQDENGQNSQLAYIVVVVNEPHAPILEDFATCTGVGNPIAICLDPILSECATSFAITGGETNFGGNIAILNNTCFNYTPLPAFMGTEQATITYCDDATPQQCATVTVTLTVPCCDAPDANDDFTTTLQDEAAILNIIANDNNANGNISDLTVEITEEPENGTAVLVGNELVYVPNAGYTGGDVVTYTITNACGLSDVAHVFITITPKPNICEDSENLCVNPFTATELCPNFCEQLGDDYEITNIESQAGCTCIPSGDDCFMYIPLPDFIGTDMVVFTACNDNFCATYIYHINVSEDCGHIVANDDNVTTTINTTTTIDVLQNDFAANNNSFIITEIEQPNNGTVQNINGVVIYTPNTDFVGIDVFTYTICDAFNNCDEATVTINVENNSDCNNDVTYCAAPFEPMQVCVNFCTVTDAVITDITGQQGNSIGSPNGNCFNYTVLGGNTSNDILTIEACNAANECETIEIEMVVECVEPIANDDAVNVNPNGTATVNVLNNDTQQCGFELDAQLLNDGLYGSVTLVNGVLTYTPNANVVDETDVLTYIACNNCDEQLCDTATIFVNINPNPTVVVIANPDEVFTNQNTSVNIPVLNNDIGQNIQITDIDYNGTGALVLNGNGTITYIPSPNFFGTEEFTYTICDNNIPPNCDSTTVQITVWPIGNPNQQPIVQDDVVQIEENQTITIPVLDNDIDPDGGTLTVTEVSSNPNGVTVINPDGTITFTPNEGFTGVVVITYTACDDGEPTLCDTGTVSIYVGFPIPNQPPVANNDNAETNENTSVIIDVLENDFDLDGDVLTVSIATNPINGTVNVNDDGTITYTPNDGFAGTDIFIYNVCDAEVCNSATVVVTVNPNPNGENPTANDDNVTVEANNPITINVLENDINPNGNLEDLIVTIIDEPIVGTTTVNPDGTITYIPPTDFTGVVTLTYEICDENGNCDTATVTITVTEPVENTINAEPDVAFTPVNTSVDIDILANDEGSNITSIIITGFPNNGNVQINPFTNVATYVPNTDFVGQDFFFYEICNSAGCDQTIVGITVFAENTPNQAPTANNDVDTTSINMPVIVNVLANDSDPENGTLTVQPTLNVEPTDGTAVVNPDGTITYTPNNGFIGEDSFVYEVCDDGYDGWPVQCTTATVVITVGTGEFSNNPPIAGDDTQVVEMNTTIEIFVLDNDEDPDNDAIIITTISTSPANGTAEITEDGTIQYTPNNGYVGNDYLIYVVCDDGNPSLCDTAYVNIIVVEEPVNEYAIFDETLEETPITICVTDYGFELPFEIAEMDFSITPTDGVVFFADTIGIDCFVYIPNEDFNGLEIFEVTACSDVPNECETITITIDVLPVNDAPIANFDTDATEINVAINIPVLENDTDPDGDDLEIIDITQMPANGTAVIANDGTIFYTPSIDFEGTDTLIYEVEDSLGLTDTAIVIITVGEIDTTDQMPPIAENDTVTTDVNEDIAIPVLDNDTDPNGDDELITVVDITQEPQNGTAVITAEGTIFYSPNIDVQDFDTLEYVIQDEEGLYDTAIVIITIGNPDTSDLIPPIANPDSATATIDSFVDIPALDNDEDPDGDVTLLTITDIMVQPENGTAEITEDSISILYTPDSSFIGEDIIVYVIEDEDGLTDFDTIFITVTVDTIQDVTVITNNDFDTLCINIAKEIFVLANDSLVDVPATSFIEITLVTEPTNGSTLINSDDGFNDNSITYIPNIDSVGIDSFAYSVCVDDICNISMVSIIVYPAENAFCDDGEPENECDDIFIPNGFSPNGDGENDFWIIPNLSECFPENEVQIFNRWGDLVFSQINYDSNNAWDGTWQQNDKDVPDGTYFYVLMYGDEKKASFIEVRR